MAAAEIYKMSESPTILETYKMSKRPKWTKRSATEWNQRFRIRLITERKKHGLSQEYLGHLVNTSQSAVSDWEAGKVEPNTNHVRNLCIALRVQPSYLIGLDDE